MVSTHLPSSIFLALIPIPNNVRWSLAFLVLRSCTQSMDTAPRSAFVATILLPSERTAVIGLTNIVKSTTQSLGPLITGVLADRGLFWVSFICSGSLKVVYDLGILAVFGRHERDKNERERPEEEDGQETAGAEGEESV
jgi:MFS family permease